MSSFSARSGTHRYESMEVPEESGFSLTSRSVYHRAITEAPVLDEIGWADDWDGPQHSSSLHEAVSEPMWEKIRRGATIAELIQTSPEEVITALRSHAVKKLGTFKMTDSDVLLAFKNKIMLTRGSDEARERHFQQNWENVINAEISKYRHSYQKAMQESAWVQDVTVAAYVVNIKDAAAGRSKGLLSVLVQKSQSGAASNQIFDLPAVRAVIEFKWCNWARKYLIIEFGLYLGWLFSFVVFLIIYIERDLGVNYEDQSYKDRFLEIVAYIMDGLSIVFMSPFLFIEYNTICSYGMRWFQTWNLIDSIAYVLQIAISYYHLFAEDLMETKIYDTLLAVQCVLLFIKVQYFARVFRTRASFMEVLGHVILKACWFFVFIILTMVSVALSFAVLYKEDHDREKESADDFMNVIRSVVTTYAVLLGDFDTDYVFVGSNRAVKGAFFLFLQVIMSITVLNLLIAVMTESYRTVMRESRLIYNMGRAEIMDELEVAIPKRWGPKLKPFCHVLIVQKEAQMNTALSGELSTAFSLRNQDAIHNDVKQLGMKMNAVESRIDNKMDKLDNKMDKLDRLIQELVSKNGSASQDSRSGP